MLLTENYFILEEEEKILRLSMNVQEDINTTPSMTLQELIEYLDQGGGEL